MLMSEWFTGSGERMSFDEIIEIIRKHNSQKGTVYVGTDSMITKAKCVFCTAICLLGETEFTNRYFVKRINTEVEQFNTLLQRITMEVQDSIDMGLKIVDYCPDVKIELHLDISKSSHKTAKFADMLIGYAKGSGFDCKVKPDAFAAYCIADKHSK